MKKDGKSKQEEGQLSEEGQSNAGLTDANLTLEETFQALEETVTKLESGNISLEESFAYYKKGMELLKNSHDIIDKVEKKVLVMNEEGNLDEF